MCITISEGDAIIFPLKMFCRPLVQVVDISERPIPCFPDIVVLGPMRLPDEVRSVKDSLDLVWGLRFNSVILRSRLRIIDIVLQVPVMDKLLYLIFQCDTLLGGVADIFMKLAVLILVPFERSPRRKSGLLKTHVCSVARKTSSYEEMRSV